MFSGTRELRGVSGNAGDVVGELNVPYAFGWTELKIETEKGKETGAPSSYKHAIISEGSDVKFQPLGSLIAYRLGNRLSSGNYTFLPKSMMVTSNVWGNKCTFELNSEVSPRAGNLPEWKNATAHVMTYTFASGHSPRVISKGSVDDKTYYAWVMPNEDESTVGYVTTSIVLKGDCSRQETDGYRDYTKTYFTDYEPKTSGSMGRVTNGKIHKLTANVTNHMALPIEFVTDYNLAGSSFSKPGTGYGASGGLRFTESHAPASSGYYDYYTVSGILPGGEYDHNRASLYDEIDRTFGYGKYFIPSAEHWWGIFISPEFKLLNWGSGAYRNSYVDYARVGGGVDDFRLSFLSDYYAPVGEKVVYATRFGKAGNEEPKVVRFGYDPYWGVDKILVYPPVQDNLLRCAYRYVYEKENGSLRIDVAYLGESRENINDISRHSWWNTRQSEGKVISRTFPMAGYVLSSFTSAPRDVNKVGAYWSTSQDNQGKPWRTHFNYAGLAGINNAFVPEYGLPVRLFRTIP